MKKFCPQLYSNGFLNGISASHELVKVRLWLTSNHLIAVLATLFPSHFYIHHPYEIHHQSGESLPGHPRHEEAEIRGCGLVVLVTALCLVLMYSHILDRASAGIVPQLRGYLQGGRGVARVPAGLLVNHLNPVILTLFLFMCCAPLLSCFFLALFLLIVLSHPRWAELIADPKRRTGQKKISQIDLCKRPEPFSGEKRFLLVKGLSLATFLP